MEDLQTKRENLVIQQEQAKEMFIMCKGAIDLLDQMIKEEKELDKEEGKTNAVKSK